MSLRTLVLASIFTLSTSAAALADTVLIMVEEKGVFGARAGTTKSATSTLKPMKAKQPLYAGLTCMTPCQTI